MPIGRPYLDPGEWLAAGADGGRPQRLWNGEFDSHRSRDRALLRLFPLAIAQFFPMNGLKLYDELLRWKHLLIFRVSLQIRRGKGRTRFRVKSAEVVSFLNPDGA